MRKQPVTMKDIAQEAGVSIATVSMIMNKKDLSISQVTRDKVLKIAQDMNYIPNSMARSLVTRKSNTLGLILPSITNPFYPEIARGAEDRARRSNYSVIICSTDDRLDQENKYIDILLEKMVDGIIFAHSEERPQQGEEIQKIEKCRLPIAVVDRDFEAANVVGKILIDNHRAAYEATTYLLEKGYKKIAYIAGPPSTKTGQDRIEGYKKALLDYGIEYDPAYVKIGSYKGKWGKEGTNELLKEGISFDAVFCGNDLIAISAMKALKDAGIKVPEEVGIMGFDGIQMGSMVDPELTTIKQPNYEMGYEAVDLLINHNTKNKTEKIILETKLIERSST